MDTKLKKNIVMQNNYICKFGPLQNKSNYTSVKNVYNDDYTVGIPLNFCDVYVLKIHPLIIAKEFCACNLNPAIINIVNDKYSDNNIENLEGVYDEILNLRTNFQCISRQNNNFPPKENEVIYTPQVIVLRDEQLNPQMNIYKVSFITINSNIDKLKILEFTEDDDNISEISNSSDIGKVKITRILSVKTYVFLKQKLELIFQTAHFAGNQVLILNDLGIVKDKLPYEDIVELLNSCILKYGHLFKEIVFALNSRTNEEQTFYDYLINKIVIPQNIINKDDDEEDKEQDKILANIIMNSS